MRLLFVLCLLASIAFFGDGCVGLPSPPQDGSSQDAPSKESQPTESTAETQPTETTAETQPTEPTTESPISEASESSAETKPEFQSAEPTATETVLADASDETSPESIPERPNEGGATDAAPDQGTSPTKRPAFLAQGDIGRTMLSCDDGQTWRANRSWETEADVAVCGKNSIIECYATACDFTNKNACETKTPCDCDHHPGAPQGMAYGDGWFVGTWGWGPPGSVRRSQDGVAWETVITGTTYGGIDFGAGTFVTGDRAPRTSVDQGKTWQAGGKADLKTPEGTVYNVRSFAFVDVGGPSGRFVVTGQSGTQRDLLVSPDKGQTWNRPTNLNPDCADNVRGIAGGNGVIVVLSGQGWACRSTDAGQTFTRVTLPEAPSTAPLWDGKSFHFWRTGKRYSSTDGNTWTATNLVLAGGGSLNLGAIAHNPTTGTYVAVRGGWNVWYTKQEFYRSQDGVQWTRLAAGTFTPSHRIRHIRFGYVNASPAGCP